MSFVVHLFPVRIIYKIFDISIHEKLDIEHLDVHTNQNVKMQRLGGWALAGSIIRYYSDSVSNQCAGLHQYTGRRAGAS